MQKKLVLIILLILFSFNTNAQVISDNGHPEHFIAGLVIGAATSYFVFKKTDNKFVSWLVGVGTASALGLFKELVDPYWFDGKRDLGDFKFTALGGVIGASIVLPLKKRNPDKNVSLLY